MTTLRAWTPQQAADWIWEHNDRFQELGGNLAHLKIRARDVAERARAAGQHERADQAARAVDAIDALIGRWRWAADQMRWVVERVPGMGLGAWIIPVAVSAVALVIVVVGIKVLSDYENANRLIDLLESGQLSPEQAKRLGLDVSPELFNVGAGGWFLVAGAVAAFWYTGRRRRAA